MKFLMIFALTVISSFSLAQSKKSLTLYTSRKSHLIEPLLEAYKKQTGIEVKHINGKAGALVQKIAQEGRATPGDLLITVDAGNLWSAASKGLLEPLKSQLLNSAVPAHLRDQKNRWFALSKRARTIFYNKKRVNPEQLKSYEALADPMWQGKLCLRTSRKVYNQSLVAGLILRLGEKETQKTLTGWVKNLAKPVFTNDTQLLQAIDKGVCQVGVANTYYLARLLKKGEARHVSVFWPNLKQGGVHVNISGGAVLKHSKNKQQAQKFLEWLITPQAQKIFAELNDEYPVVAGVEWSSVLKKWGTFSPEKTPLTSIGPSQKKAVMLMDRSHYR